MFGKVTGETCTFSHCQIFFLKGDSTGVTEASKECIAIWVIFKLNIVKLAS